MTRRYPIDPHAGLWVSTCCKIDGQPLREVNPGHADGGRSLWVGACVKCGRQYVVTADICPVPSRGQVRHA